MCNHDRVGLYILIYELERHPALRIRSKHEWSETVMQEIVRASG